MSHKPPAFADTAISAVNNNLFMVIPCGDLHIKDAS
jgi:hypothetical protein